MAFVVYPYPAECSPVSRHAQRSRRSQSRRRTAPAAIAGRAGVMDEVVDWIENTSGFGQVKSVSGAGSSGWASMSRVKTESGKELFVKQSSRGVKEMFEGEAEGLIAMFGANAIMVPEVQRYGDAAGGSYIVMDYLDMRAGYSQKELGEKLARMHLAVPAAPEAQQGQFGFAVPNTIGGTPQPNEWTDDWVEFLREKRLGHQIRLAKDSTISELGRQLLPRLETFFHGLEIRPCILHGDLWSGNIGGVDGHPTIFDPACYYGHSEAEFGMSWCAGFSEEFYSAYHALIPREGGFEERKQLYLLYHYLNHYNLFGGGYKAQAVSIMRQLLVLSGTTGDAGRQ